MTGAAASLPPLRQDLRLHKASPDRDGSPAWSIQDPVTNRFFRIGWLEFECLLRWPGNPEQIADNIATTTPLSVETEQVEAFARFLEQHRLVRPTAEGVARLAAAANSPGWKHWRWWLHHYLFIRVPLIRPERWLAAASALGSSDPFPVRYRSDDHRQLSRAVPGRPPMGPVYAWIDGHLDHGGHQRLYARARHLQNLS